MPIFADASQVREAFHGHTMMVGVETYLAARPNPEMQKIALDLKSFTEQSLDLRLVATRSGFTTAVHKTTETPDLGR